MVAMRALAALVAVLAFVAQAHAIASACEAVTPNVATKVSTVAAGKMDGSPVRFVLVRASRLLLGSDRSR